MGLLAQVTQTGADKAKTATSSIMLAKTVDFNRISRLCRVQNSTLCKQNVVHLANHLA